MTPDAERQLLSLPFALVVVGPDLRIATLNPAAEQLFGLSVRKLVDARVQDVLRFVDPSIITRMQDSEAQIFAPAALVALLRTLAHSYAVLWSRCPVNHRARSMSRSRRLSMPQTGGC